MAKFNIEGNALEFNTLVACITTSEGTPGQLRVKDIVLDRIFTAWPELDQDNESVERLDSQNPEAHKARGMVMNTDEQGALAETFLAAIKSKGTNGARFRLFKKAAKLIQISGWWDRQTTEKLSPFKHGDNPEKYSDADTDNSSAASAPIA